VPDKHVSTYDKMGHEIRRDQYKHDGILSDKYVVAYDGAGNRTVESHEYKDGRRTRSSRTVSTFDIAGKKTAEMLYLDGNLSHKMTWKYDDKGNLLEDIRYGPDGSPSEKSTFIYDQFDSYGNWGKATVSEIKKQGKSDFVRTMSMQRRITYQE